VGQEDGAAEVIVYHQTDSGEAIRQQGFQDGVGNYLTENIYSGVWVSDRPLDAEGAVGRDLLVVEVPDSELEPFEWLEEGKGYREFLVPADVLNRYPIEDP
jgi:hypothetical protein